MWFRDIPVNIGVVFRLLTVLCCVANCCATNSEFAEFANEPVKFFQDNKSRYTWLSDDMKQMLCQLPPLKNARDRIEKLVTDRQPKSEIDLSLVKNRVKEFYKKLLKDSGDIGDYLIKVVEEAVDKTKFIYREKIVMGASRLSFVSHGLDDVPPYLRIIGNHGTVFLVPDSKFSKDLGEVEKASYYEKLAREQHPEYDDKYEWKYAGLKRVNDHQVSEWVEYIKKPQKICAAQPDFKEVDSKERWTEVYENEDREKQDLAIQNAIDEEVQYVALLLFMDDTNSKKYKFADPQDQQKYEDWFSKIQTRFQNPEKVTENFRAHVSYTSIQNAEYWLIHEIAHVIEYAWRLKTKNKTANSNPELFSLYVETKLADHKTMRLWEMYEVLCSNCLAEFLLKKPNPTDMQQPMQSLEKLQLYEHELTEKNKDSPENLQDKDFHEHTYALYNAIKLHEKKLSILEVLKEISTAKPAQLTPQNFPELINYLMN